MDEATLLSRQDRIMAALAVLPSPSPIPAVNQAVDFEITLQDLRPLLKAKLVSQVDSLVQPHLRYILTADGKERAKEILETQPIKPKITPPQPSGPQVTPQMIALAQRERRSLAWMSMQWGLSIQEIRRLIAQHQQQATRKPAHRKTPQEVQQTMPKGIPNPNFPGDTALLQFAEEMRAQNVPHMIEALAAKLDVSIHSAQKWLYRATERQRNGEPPHEQLAAKRRVDWPSDRELVAEADAIKTRGGSVSKELCAKYDCTNGLVWGRIGDARERLGLPRKMMEAAAAPAQPATPAAVAPAAAPDDDILFADDLPASLVVPPVAAALPPERVIEGVRLVEQTDASAGLTAAQEGILADVAQADIVMVVKHKYPGEGATTGTLRTDLPTGQQLETFVQDLAGHEPTQAEREAMFAEEQLPTIAFRRGVMTGPAGTLLNGQEYIVLPKAEHETLLHRLASLETTEEKRPSLLGLITDKQVEIEQLRADVSERNARLQEAAVTCHRLLAENEQLQADLKVALLTIEQAAQPGTTYLLIDRQDGIEPVAAEPEQILAVGDEYPNLIVLDGKRRYLLWHCIDTITLPGGHVVCVLRPGSAETAGEEAA